MQENKISSLNTYKDAIKELIKYGFVNSTTVQDVYWINPEFFFKGDRLKKYSSNVKKEDITGD
jgi:hypothetical protein